MARPAPPAYAWDWFARQRLLWREARTRLVGSGLAAAARYAGVEDRPDVLALLRHDYDRDPEVRAIVLAAVSDVAFMGRTSGRFRELGIRAAPRGLRWWWTELTGEELEGRPAPGHPAPEPTQLSMSEILEAYGD